MNNHVSEPFRAALEGFMGSASGGRALRTDHRYVTHPTYTGPGCAICGRPERDHDELLAERIDRENKRFHEDVERATAPPLDQPA